MFQIELLSGGVFWVYAVYPPAESYLNKQFIFPMETGGAE